MIVAANVKLQFGARIIPRWFISNE